MREFTSRIMWKGVLCDIALGNVGTLEYFGKQYNSENPIDEICHFIEQSINVLPWYFNVPVKMLACITGILCLLILRTSPGKMSAANRTRLIGLITKLPIFNLLNRLVRSLVFLTVFDILPSPVQECVESPAKESS